MTGRDIVKFIVHNNLLDKSVSDLKLLFLDYTVDIESVKYDLKPNGRFITSYISGEETYKVSSEFLHDVRLDTLRCLDSCRSQSAYVDTYSTPFYTWMKSLSDDTSITHVLVVYAAQDPEFRNNSAPELRCSRSHTRPVRSRRLQSSHNTVFSPCRGPPGSPSPCTGR